MRAQDERKKERKKEERLYHAVLRDVANVYDDAAGMKFLEYPPLTRYVHETSNCASTSRGSRETRAPMERERQGKGGK